MGKYLLSSFIEYGNSNG